VYTLSTVISQAGNFRVPYLDIKAQYAEIRYAIHAAIDAVLESTAFTDGPFVERFEREYALYCGANECIAVGSGTDAVHVALAALGVGPGDEVITQANTFIATVEAIVYTGARPVFVDVAPPTYTLDVDAIEAAITPHTRVIIPVHLFGQPCDVDAVRLLSKRYGLSLVHDASQAHGARVKGERIGAREIACFSFYPGKNLGAYGQGGAVVCNDPGSAARMRSLRAHGSDKRYIHRMLGYNYRMDSLQAAVLSVKLPYLDAWTEGRRRVANIYDRAFPEYERPLVPREVEHVYHVYPLFVDERARVREELAGLGIETRMHYPIPCHLQEGYTYLGYTRGDFPYTEKIADSELSLPIYPEITTEQIEAVIAAVHAAQASSADRMRERSGSYRLVRDDA
jgi:dTDP-4-amino-4,6-dideoxygalactose transaminase